MKFNDLKFLIATGYERPLRRFEGLLFFRGWILVVLRKPERAAP